MRLAHARVSWGEVELVQRDVVAMDDLHNAIQDAAYIGAICDKHLHPTTSLALPSDEEVRAFQRRHRDALTFETVLSEPLGWYCLQAFLKSLGVTRAAPMDFVADCQAYTAISSPAMRLQRACDLVVIYFGLAPHDDAEEGSLGGSVSSSQPGSQAPRAAGGSFSVAVRWHWPHTVQCKA
ncbi:hypothetical protein EON62_05035 [archaeon]|nr:MAG: hypothetical protein EON62_05035 [archaeon]